MPRLLHRITWLLLGLVTLGHAKAADDFIVGVGTHLLDGSQPPGRPVKLIEEAGISSVRDDAFWSTAEPEKRHLYIAPAWRRYLSLLHANQLNSLLILGYGNEFYENYAKPRSQLVKDAFANYVNFVTYTLRGQVEFYEVWNEWDLENPSDPAFTLEYAELVNETAQRIRLNDPQARVLAGAVTTRGIEEGFADRLIKAGVMEHLDGLSLHPYVYCRKTLKANSPESWMKWLSEVDQRLAGLAGRPVPLYLTQMSWPSSDEPCGVSETTQAAFLARSFFLARIHPNIKGMWWYDLLNNGFDPKAREDNFGLLGSDLREKLAYATLKSITPVLTEYEYNSKQSAISENLYQLNFAKGDEQVLVAWAIGQPRQVKIESTGALQGPVQMLDTREPHLGRVDTDSQWECIEHRCTAVVTLNEFPRIISLGKANWLFTR